MAFFDRQINLVKKQLGQLETSQRMAIFLCGIIVAGSVFMLTQWSLQREMIPLYADALSDEEITGITRQLKMMGEAFAEKDKAIWVRPDDRRRLLMELAMSNAGPKSARLTFQDLIRESKVFISEAKTRWQQNVALMNELAIVIETSEQVKDASVFIADEDKRTLLGKPSPPKATVKVTMSQGNKLDKGLVQSLAALVANAVPRLRQSNVSIVDLSTGRSYVGDDLENEVPTKLVELRHEEERVLQNKIKELLSYIPGVIVGVSVKLDEESSSSVATTLDEPHVSSEKTEEEEYSNMGMGIEPGVEANIGVALQGGGKGSHQSKAKSTTEFAKQYGGTVTESKKKPGAIVDASASIQVPKSYLIGVHKSTASDPSAEPDAAALDDLVRSVTEDIENSVKPILIAENEPIVNVSVFSDSAFAYVPEAPPSEPAEAGNKMLDFVSTNGRQLGLAMLALLALGMMLHVVRKSGESLAAPGETKSAADATTGSMIGELFVDSGPIGEASAPDGFLIAPETDENSIRARHIAQQVAELVENDPEGAASLVRRWIEREP